jgi:transposase-like protein
MKSDTKPPETLLEAVRYFSDPDAALAAVVSLRWPNGVICPHCASIDATFMESRRVWQCRAKECRKQFSAKVGTIFEDSPIGLDKWLPCLWMLVNCKNGISSYEIGRALGVTQKTAWFMLHRVRLAMQTKTFSRMKGDVEVDETYIGGKARNMHPGKRARFEGSRWVGKVAVMGLLERGEKGHSRVRTEIVPNVQKRHLQPKVRQYVEPGSDVHTDELMAYQGLNDAYVHNVINHSVSYVNGKIHTNGLENFWSLLKRGIRGTYVSIEPFHLFRYLDEQVFRFNNRKDTDGLRFVNALLSIAGKRLTYKALTGSALPETC